MQATLKGMDPQQLTPQFQQAMDWYDSIKDQPTDFVQALEVVELLHHLKVNDTLLTAALLSDRRIEQAYSQQKLADTFGQNIANFVADIHRLNRFKDYRPDQNNKPEQHERLRRMLLAMIDDVRVMLVKLAYRVVRLRHIKKEDEASQRAVAQETMDIFAPLANRLGVAHLKWQLEDLAFRCLQPELYRSLANKLESKRTERENYIQDFLQQLNHLLDEEGIGAKTKGRSKHIFSIWNKMQRKNVPFEQLFDIHAVRVHVDRVQDCYRVLGLVHTHWTPIAEEFDDYIAQPKANGYQSIHTVVFGAIGLPIEVQIRTHQMHLNAEYGVAAHWQYKENKSLDGRWQDAIAQLRRLLENQDDPELEFSNFNSQLSAQQVYVITPNGEIVELPAGSTPLDFAYAIHTEVGHGCRGAKINGQIRPLNTKLKTGDQLEILSTKNGTPNRNWLNASLGYITTNKARSHIRQYFNRIDRKENQSEGKVALEKILKRFNATKEIANLLQLHFGFNQKEDFHEAVGKGQISDSNITKALQRLINPEVEEEASKPLPRSYDPTAKDASKEYDVTVMGVGNLKTNLATCCAPHPPAPIVGYVTRGKGITIHRHDCPNVLSLSEAERMRLIQVSWGKTRHLTEWVMEISAFDRKGLLKDIMEVLENSDINLMSANTYTDPQSREVTMTMGLETTPECDLGLVLNRLEMVNHVSQVNIVPKAATPAPTATGLSRIKRWMRK